MDILKRAWFSWLGPVVFLVALNMVYFSPVFSGKTLQQDDILMGKLKQKEIVDYRDATGEEPLWTNAMFSGMPTFQLSTFFANNVLVYVQRTIVTVFGSASSMYIIASLMVGFFFLLRSYKVGVLLSMAGAVAFGLSAFFIIGFGAGHNAKVRTAAYIAPMLVGIFLTLRGKHWLGFAITALFVGMSVKSNHLQITYYAGLMVLIILIVYAIDAYKSKTLPLFVKRGLILTGAAVLGIGPNVGNLWSTYAYTQETMRGGNDMIEERAENEGSDKSKSGGLTYDYAMSWSMTRAETFSLFVPMFTGGGARESYEGSKLYDQVAPPNPSPAQKEQINAFVGQASAWGESMGNGAYYLGAVVVFLFVLGLLLINGPTRQWALAVFILGILMAWGRHFEWFSHFLYNHLPIYNKFRVPHMALVMVCTVVPLVAFVGIQRFIDLCRENQVLATKNLKRAFYMTGGLALALALLGPTLFSLEGQRDEQLLAMFQQNNINLSIENLIDQRTSLMRISAFKALAWVAVVFGILWYFLKGKINLRSMSIAILALVIIDLWIYDKDQVGEAEFLSERQYNSEFTPSTADQLILKDSDPHYRVWNSTQGLTADSRTSYYHKSVGGYHGAKLSRYQNLIDHQLSQGNMSAFDMLNTKWIIAENRQQQGQQNAQINPGALGNAWFPTEVIWASGPNDEMSKLSNFDPAAQVVIDQQYQSAVGQSVQNDSRLSRNTIKLTQYDPKELRYSASVQGRPALAVFSEVWYRAPSQEWKLYVDGEEIELIRVNYLLRAGVLPQGEHEVVMRFEPDTYYVGEKINLAFSILLVLAVGGAITIEVRNRKEEEEEKQ